MKTLIEDLLVLARLGEGQPLVVEAVDLVEIARNAAGDHAIIDPSRPVSATGSDRVDVQGDGERLYQVVSNLLANIRVHTPPGTLATVDVRDEDAWALVTVSDDGPGIPPESLEHVFERFYRADPSRSRNSGGSGLGLSIVAAIVEAHGGTVDVENDGGARFSVRLPKAIEHSAPEVET